MNDQNEIQNKLKIKLQADYEQAQGESNHKDK